MRRTLLAACFSIFSTCISAGEAYRDVGAAESAALASQPALAAFLIGFHQCLASGRLHACMNNYVAPTLFSPKIEIFLHERFPERAAGNGTIDRKDLITALSGGFEARHEFDRPNADSRLFLAELRACFGKRPRIRAKAGGRYYFGTGMNTCQVDNDHGRLKLVVFHDSD